MRPMLASPTERPPNGPQWRHEVKWDGIRIIATARGGVVRLHTRSERECTSSFPEITQSALRDYDDLTLDGEIVALVNGRPDFSAVMHRLAPGGFPGSRTASRSTSRSARTEGAGSSPPPEDVTLQFIAFDVLRAAGHDVMALPWSSRRELLSGAGLANEAVVVPETHADGSALFDATFEAGLEGVVSKRIDAPYRPGIRSEDWVKSVHRRTESFVVGGWRPVAGTTGSLGALLLGEFQDGALRYRGRVGTGFSQGAGAALLDVLVPTPHCPFDHPQDALPEEDIVGSHWVRPRTMVDIMFLQHSAGGRLRQPSYKGLRLDLGVTRA